MKVSIITVVYNGEKTIAETIDSVLAQDYKSIEYLVIDGQSTDQTKSIIRSYGDKIQTFLSEPDSGMYDAMNKGIALATGEIIGILNADDVYNSNHTISDVVQQFLENQSDGVYGDLVYVDSENQGQVKRNWKAGRYKKGAFLWGWMPPHPTFFIKKDWYHRYGVFRMDLGSAADYELMLRMIHKNHAKLSYLQQVTVRMRVGGVSNISLKNRLFANRNDRLAWNVNDLKPYPFTVFMKPLRKILQFFP